LIYREREPKSCRKSERGCPDLITDQTSAHDPVNGYLVAREEWRCPCCGEIFLGFEVIEFRQKTWLGGREGCDLSVHFGESQGRDFMVHWAYRGGSDAGRSGNTGLDDTVICAG